MRPIDADALKKTLEDMCSASNNIKQRRVEDIMLHNIFSQIIDDEPTIETEFDNGWISVKDRLPKYDETVLVVNEDGYMHTAVRIKGSIAMIDEWQIKFGVCFTDNDVWEEDEQGKITHWQYLPEPPKGE